MKRIIKGHLLSNITLAIGLSIIIIMIYMQIFEYDKLYDKYSMLLFGIGILSSSVSFIRYVQLKRYLKNNNLKKIKIKNKYSMIFLILNSLALIFLCTSLTEYLIEVVLIVIIVLVNYIFLMLPFNEFHVDTEYIYYEEFKARINEIKEIEDSHGFTVIIKGEKWSIEIPCSNYVLQQNLLKELNKLISQI